MQTIVHVAKSEYPSFFLSEAATNGLGPSHARFIVAHDEIFIKHPTTCYHAVENMLPITKTYIYRAAETKALVLWCINIL